MRERTIAGVAYWFPHQGNVSTALLFDVRQRDVRRVHAGAADAAPDRGARAGEFLTEAI